MYSLIFIFFVALTVYSTWLLKLKWDREVAERRRTMKRCARRVQSGQEQVLRQAAEGTRARQFSAKY